MFQGNNFSMIRGDSESITVVPSEPFVNGDRVDMTIRKTPDDGTVYFRKTITNFTEGSAVIPINPADTANMDFGKYRYDIQITFADGTVATLFEPAVFDLKKECTYG